MSRDSSARESPADTFEHAREVLEFDAVLEFIGSKCVNSGARERIREIEPRTDRAWIGDRLREISEVREFHSVSGHLPIADTACAEAVRRAVRRREIVPGEGLNAIAALERSAVSLQRSMREETRYPMLRGIIERMLPHPDLIAAVERAIERDGAVKDTATPRLQSIRKGILRARDELRRHAEQLARSYGSPEYATYTGSRHLLLVPREKCKKKEGIVHATSHSGGSLYFEPFSLVERNNALETLIQDERAEEARVLAELTGMVTAVADEFLENVAIWELLDGLDAKARFAEEFRCTNPAASGDRGLRLADARHPLLELSLRAESAGRSAVPLDIDLANDRRVLIITGPNAGGKTVSLKTLGLACLMFQSGLPFPCSEGTRLPIFRAVRADIGDEQSIATSLSTFTSHLKQLDEMCRGSDSDTLCLVDEIGDGTDPDEGAALAIAAIERLRDLGATVVATTHYGKVKAYALRTEGVENASMAYDDANDEPLYRMLQGTAGRSRGIDTARRLGFEDSVVRRAESLVGEESYRLENVLSQLESTQIGLERERAALRSQSDELNRLLESYGEKERALASFKQEHEQRVKKEAEDLLVETRREIEALVKRIRETSAEKSAVGEAHRHVEERLREVRARPAPRKAKHVAEGDLVSLSPSGRPSGRVIEVQRDHATVEIGGKRLTVKKWNLYKAAEDASEERRTDAPVNVTADSLDTTDVNVRGMSREEAIEAVDLFLDRAVLSGAQEVRIIHGVGEGVLLRAIRDMLRGDPRIESSRQGAQHEGGVGVTVARLR